MSRTQELYNLWAIDLSQAEIAALTPLADGRFNLAEKSEQELLCPDSLSGDGILILCLSLAAWKRLFAKDQAERKFVSRMPKSSSCPKTVRWKISKTPPDTAFRLSLKSL